MCEIIVNFNGKKAIKNALNPKGALAFAFFSFFEMAKIYTLIEHTLFLLS